MLPQPLQLRISLPNALPADSQKQQDQLTRFIMSKHALFATLQNKVTFSNVLQQVVLFTNKRGRYA